MPDVDVVVAEILEADLLEKSHRWDFDVTEVDTTNKD